MVANNKCANIKRILYKGVKGKGKGSSKIDQQEQKAFVLANPIEPNCQPGDLPIWSD